MDLWLGFILLFSGIIALLLMGIPVAFVFGVVNIVALLIYSGGQISILGLVASSAYESVSTFQYSAVPLFALMGEILYHSGLAEGIYLGMGKLIGRVPGRLAIIGTGAGALFGAASGSSMASVATIGSSLAPEMIRQGYAKWLALGSIAASGGLAVLIPPSSLMVIFGGATGLPIGKLLIGGAIPGLTLAGLMVLLIIIMTKLKPEFAPSGEIEVVSLGERFRALLDFVPIFVMIVGVLGSIFVGFATPSEAAAVGAFLSFALAGLYRRLTVIAVKEALLSTINITCMCFLIITASTVFSQILALTGIAPGLTRAIVGLGVDPLLVLVLMNIVVIIMGCIMDPVSIMLIIVPVFLPIAQALHFDLIWWALIMMVNIELGLITPPFGLNLFVAKGIAPKGTELFEIYRAIWPFVILEVFLIILMIFFPPLATWLPSLMN